MGKDISRRRFLPLTLLGGKPYEIVGEAVGYESELRSVFRVDRLVPFLRLDCQHHRYEVRFAQ